MTSRRFSGLFINAVEANDSIYESGRMAYECLLGSDRYSLAYATISRDQLNVDTGYDFYFFNYHMVTMSWLDTKTIKESLPGIKMTMVLEVAPNNPFVYCSPDDFDVYCVLDPTLKASAPNVFAFPRPLEVSHIEAEYVPGDVPVIGTFGFATPGKGFERLVEVVNEEFDRAIVKINIPPATYADAGERQARQLALACMARAKTGIEVIVTHDFMTKEELLRWCGRNTINCFLYDRDMPGLAATTDQAIASGRPLLISRNDTFRHIQQFITPYPEQTLRDAIKNTAKGVRKMKEAWSPERFRHRFEVVLGQFAFDEEPERDRGPVALPTIPEISYLQRVKNKVAARTRLRKLAKMVGLNSSLCI